MDTPNSERMLERVLGRRRMSALAVQPRSNSFYDGTLVAMARGAADTALVHGVRAREEAHKELLVSWLTLVSAPGGCCAARGRGKLD